MQPPQTPKWGQRGATRARSRLRTVTDARDVEARLALDDLDADLFAGQCAFDEDDLAVDVRDAAAFLVQRFDGQFDHGGRRGLYALPLRGAR